MFADYYFKKYGSYIPLIGEDVSEETTLFVMIPCYKEPDILLTLDSLVQCNPTQGGAEVLVVINEPENCDPDISAFNLSTYNQVAGWIAKQERSPVRFFVAGPVKLPQKWAGVGMARKRGMDEGLWRFSKAGKPDGIIVSLDADTLVEPNYLNAIEHFFTGNKGYAGTTISFSHQTVGLDELQKKGIELYEKYLSYYKTALEYTGFPHAMYTIGSAFAVSAWAYLKRGGMTRRKAGEDFYFLTNLTQTGKVGEITETTVHPSARISDRVPFGTGIAMKQWMYGEEDLDYTYDIQAFYDLKDFFSKTGFLYRRSKSDCQKTLSSLAPALIQFLESDHFFDKTEELSANCSTLNIFRERFFQVFNAFKVMKYLNFSRDTHYPPRRLDEVCEELQQLIQAPK